MMYGTVAKLRLKQGVGIDKLHEMEERFMSRNVPGFISEYIYQMDEDPQTYYMVAIFENEEAYRANANDPAQHDDYLFLRALLESDPEWHDGKIIFPLG